MPQQASRNNVKEESIETLGTEIESRRERSLPCRDESGDGGSARQERAVVGRRREERKPDRESFYLNF